MNSIESLRSNTGNFKLYVTLFFAILNKVSTARYVLQSIFLGFGIQIPLLWRAIQTLL